MYEAGRMALDLRELYADIKSCCFRGLQSCHSDEQGRLKCC